MKFKYIVYLDNINQRHEFRLTNIIEAYACYHAYRDMAISGGIVDLSTGEVFEYFGPDEDE